jgi:DNA-binding transcriptional MocR family regulator
MITQSHILPELYKTILPKWVSPQCNSQPKPDLNPIEHLWDTMGKRLRTHPRRPANQQELGQRLQEIWEDIGQDEIRTFINSMGRRCLQLIRARGNNKY